MPPESCEAKEGHADTWSLVSTRSRRVQLHGSMGEVGSSFEAAEQLGVERYIITYDVE
jgi:hypothetical protein